MGAKERVLAKEAPCRSLRVKVGATLLKERSKCAPKSRRWLTTRTVVPKVGRGERGERDTVDWIGSGAIDLVINTVDSDPEAVRDSASLRRTALLSGVPYCTTAAAARASVGAIRALQLESIGVRTLQEIHGLTSG